MNKEETKQKLREIVNKSARTMTDEDRLFLNELANELGIQRTGKSSCQKCWHDLAFRCWQGIAADEEKEAAKTAKTERKYILRAGVDVLFGSVRVNAATMTDELAEKIIARGFDKKFFEKCE